ncbi:hypothetical protein HYFRA_00011542 [Hymenoscyphus fraxineus]|uniref:Peroxin 20 n=1 Tax=Hymenoscyphus fraxineus TaxID=746836 RepID=A0A9N9PWV7_9HELO|nr:hypothetical protein HYFRA_00011542 [Hymenoscyphus fraxineus]
MAESMCGPSNALNTFQKHTSVDRTLQQDRLINRQSPSQSFRSSPGPNAGLLDPEFEAFQAGRPPLDSQVATPFTYTHTPSPFQAAGPSWSSDFQNLNIAGPAAQRQTHTPQPQQHEALGGWHQEFARQQSGMSASHVQSPVQSGLQSSYTPMASGMHMGGMYMGGSMVGGFTGPQVASSIAVQKQPATDMFDEEAFARAFEEAEQAEQELESLQAEPETKAEVEVATEVATETQQTIILDDSVLVAESAERLMEMESNNQTLPPIGADSILPQNQTERDTHNHDDLARTAGQLLTNVSNDTSDKFQQSKFLDLMRAFRDKEVLVNGDKIVAKPYADLENDAERAVGVAKGATENVVSA